MKKRTQIPGPEAPLAERTATSAILARAAALKESRPVLARAEQLVKEQEALAAQAAEAEVADESRQVRRARERQQAKVESRILRLLERDDERVRAVLARKEPLHAVLPLAGTTPVDELLWFIMDHLDLGPALGELTLPAEGLDKEGRAVRKRSMFEPQLTGLLSLLARFAGLDSGPETQAALLSDPRWMTLLGFNLQEVQEGANRRSLGLRGKTRDEAKRFVEADEAGPVRENGWAGAPRGALSSQTLAAWEGAWTVAQLQAFLDQVVRSSVRALGVRGPREVIVDTTTCELPRSFVGGGWVSRQVKVQSKARRPRKVRARIYGLKVWVAMDAETGLVLAVKIDTAEKPENLHVVELLRQVQANLAPNARVGGVVLDRGFLDGDLLYVLEQEFKANWLVPAKSNMLVTDEARGRVTKALEAARQGQEPDLATAQRLAAAGQTSQGVRFFAANRAPGRAPLVVAEVNRLTCTDWYGPGGAESSRVYRKDFKPTPLYATVVLSWPDRPQTEAEDCAEHDPDATSEDGADQSGPLVLLSRRPESGLARFDRYDQRSLIENRVFRDGKQHFGLGKSQARNLAAFWSATVMSLCALNLYRGFQAHLAEVERQAEKATDRRAPGLGLLRYRRLAEVRNRDLVLVLVAECYALLPMREFLHCAGVALL